MGDRRRTLNVNADYEPPFRSRGRKSAPSRSVIDMNQRRLIPRCGTATNRFMISVGIQLLNVNADHEPGRRYS